MGINEKLSIPHRHKMNIQQCWQDGIYAFFDKHHKLDAKYKTLCVYTLAAPCAHRIIHEEENYCALWDKSPKEHDAGW